MRQYRLYLKKFTNSGNIKDLVIILWAENPEQAKDLWADDKRYRNTTLKQIEEVGK